jgi:hypothetical protein
VKATYKEDNGNLCVRPVAQHHFKELREWMKVKGITLNEGLFIWK